MSFESCCDRDRVPQYHTTKSNGKPNAHVGEKSRKHYPFDQSEAMTLRACAQDQLTGARTQENKHRISRRRQTLGKEG